MSTRCHIRIKEGEEQFQLYHHHDGYPEGVGAELKKYLATKNHNGSWYADEIANELVKGKLVADDEYEITSCIHGDEEYVYVIDCVAQTLKCYAHKWDESFDDCCIASREVVIP